MNGKEMHAPTMTDINQLTGSLTDRDEHDNAG